NGERLQCGASFSEHQIIIAERFFRPRADLSRLQADDVERDSSVRARPLHVVEVGVFTGVIAEDERAPWPKRQTPAPLAPAEVNEIERHAQALRGDVPLVDLPVGA